MTSSFCLSVCLSLRPTAGKELGALQGRGSCPAEGRVGAEGPGRREEEGHPRGPESGGGGLCSCGAGMARRAVYGARPGPTSQAGWLRPTRGRHVPAWGQWAEAPPRQAEPLTGPRAPRTDRPCVPGPGSNGLTSGFNR